MLPNPRAILSRLCELQRNIRDAVIQSRDSGDLNKVDRESAADTIYRLDTEVEPIIEEYCAHWGKSLPMVVIAEGLEPEMGKVFPAGIREQDAAVRIILDPVDGTRGLMYDKRSAWSLAGVAPNKGASTRLSDIEIAVMTELPTAKLGRADVLWAIRGQGACAERQSLATDDLAGLPLRPSQSPRIDHGFASISSFFPGTKIEAAELMEQIAMRLCGPADVRRAIIFEDQYISTGGQFYELIVGHDRFNADLRPLFYRIKGQTDGLCAHPYDACTMLIAVEAGVILTDGLGQPLDGPLDVTTGLSWAGYANKTLRDQIEPIVDEFFRNHLRGK